MSTSPVSLGACRVLVVEDNEPTQRLIAAHLAALGVGRIEFAGDGVDALAKIPGFAPDLIVLDIMMPRMNGIEFLGHLRADPDWCTVPVLVQTALDSQDDRTRVYSAGANDMLTKPLNRSELAVRVRTHLENRMLVRGYLDRLRLDAELEAARRMQEALLPPQALLDDIENRLGLHIAAHFETCSELGGDFWGVHRHRADDRDLGLFTVDFSGHGIGAALNTFRLHTLMSNFRPGNRDPAAYLATLNDRLAGLLPRGQYATMFYGILDAEEGTLTYSGAGSPPPLIGDRTSGRVTVLDASGVPLGMVKGSRYQTRVAAFPQSSVLFLYSDAFYESPRPDGSMLELAGAAALFGDCLKTAGNQPYLRCLVDAFRAGAFTGALSDDLTLLTVTCGDRVQSCSQSASHSASVRTVTPSSSALRALEPASAPATR